MPIEKVKSSRNRGATRFLSLRAASRGVVALMTAVALVGCGDPEPSLSINEIGIVRGEVVANERGRIVVDYGGEFLVQVLPALILPIDVCTAGWEALADFILEQAPVGSKVWIDASRPLKNEGESIPDPSNPDETVIASAVSAFIFSDNGGSDLPTDRATLNELAVREGLVAPFPVSGLPDVIASSSTPEEVRSELSDHDFTYWLRFARAWEVAFDAGVGPLRDCRDGAAQLRAQRDSYSAEIERDFRQFRRRLNDLERRQREAERSGGGLSCDGDGDGVCNE